MAEKRQEDHPTCTWSFLEKFWYRHTRKVMYVQKYISYPHTDTLNGSKFSCVGEMNVPYQMQFVFSLVPLILHNNGKSKAQSTTLFNLIIRQFDNFKLGNNRGVFAALLVSRKHDSSQNRVGQLSTTALTQSQTALCKANYHYKVGGERWARWDVK